MCLYVTCFAYAHYYLLSIYCRMRKQSHILGKMIGKAELPVDVPNPLDDDVSGDVNSLAYLAYFHSSSMMVNIYISPTSFMPITTCSFYLSVFAECADCLTLLARRSVRPSSVGVHHPLADDISGDVNYLAYLTYFQSSSLMVNIYFLTYAHYYLLSVYLLQNARTVSRSWQDVQQSRALC